MENFIDQTGLCLVPTEHFNKQSDKTDGNACSEEEGDYYEIRMKGVDETTIPGNLPLFMHLDANEKKRMDDPIREVLKGNTDNPEEETLSDFFNSTESGDVLFDQTAKSISFRTTRQPKKVKRAMYGKTKKVRQYVESIAGSAGTCNIPYSPVASLMLNHGITVRGNPLKGNAKFLKLPGGKAKSAPLFKMTDELLSQEKTYWAGICGEECERSEETDSTQRIEGIDMLTPAVLQATEKTKSISQAKPSSSADKKDLTVDDKPLDYDTVSVIAELRRELEELKKNRNTPSVPAVNIAPKPDNIALPVDNIDPVGDNIAPPVNNIAPLQKAVEVDYSQITSLRDVLALNVDKKTKLKIGNEYIEAKFDLSVQHTIKQRFARSL